MNTSAPSLLRRWLTLCLVGLLALGPFLHGHFGASHDTGFHLDGVHALHSHAPVGLSAASHPQDESPALGVATSLPQPEDKGWSAWDLALWVLVLVLPLLSLQQGLLARCGRARPAPSALYRPGLPPPGLAPPLA